MQQHHREFFDSLDWENHLQDATGVEREPPNGSERDIDTMLSILETISEDRLEEWAENQHYTPPAERRRQEREAHEHKLSKIADKPAISGT